MSAFTIQGIDNLKRIFADFPEKAYRKPVIAGFRKAAEPVKKAMAETLPSNLKSLRKAIKIRPGKGRSLTLAVGFYANQGIYRNTRGQQWDPYQLVYWHNYGTLSKRASSHTFKMPVRKKSAGRNGITPGLFVERAWEQAEPQVQKIFESTLETEITKFFEKEAAK
jgi:hypothetical protein